MRVLELPAGKSSREWGRIHGESFRGEIGALAQIRFYLCTKVGGFTARVQVLAAAAAHLPVLERYGHEDLPVHPALYGRGASAAEAARLHRFRAAEIAPAARGESPRQRVPADPANRLGPSDAGLQSSQHLESYSYRTGNPSDPE